MDPPRLTPAALDAAPVALVAALAAWAFWDFLAIPQTLVAQLFAAVLLAGVAGLILGLRFRVVPVRRVGLALVALSYLAAHTIALPLNPAPALGFLTATLVAVELRILAERFAPVLRMDLDPETRGRVEEALARCLIRIAAAAGLGFLGSTLTADLALSGSLPMRSIATALVLSLALIAVVLLLAFWPSIERRTAPVSPPDAAIQTPK